MKAVRKFIKQLRERKKGFTLIELVVAIGIMLVIAAVATPFLLGHIKDAKVASMNEQLLNISAAFNSYYTKNGGILSDSDGDNDFLDEMINDGYLSTNPSGKNNLNWTVEFYTDASNNTSYFVKIANANEDGYTYVHPLISDLDKAIDGEDNNASGRLQYTDDNTAKNATIYYLLQADPGMATWHP